MDQRYGGLPALASFKPERIAKKAAMAGCSTSLNFIGPLTRASNWLPTRVNICGINPHYTQSASRRTYSGTRSWRFVRVVAVNVERAKPNLLRNIFEMELPGLIRDF